MKVACTVLEGESGGNPADLLRYQSLRANCYHKIRLYRLDYQSLFQENRERYEISTLPIFVYQYPGF